MESSNGAAADAAQARVVACQSRLARLAEGQHVGTADVHAARAALTLAQHRAEAARRRLTAAQLRRIGDPSLPDTDLLTHVGSGTPDVATLRAATRDLAGHGLHATYFSLGGNCTPLELDAFAHRALELPTSELMVLAHAVWELTEL